MDDQYYTRVTDGGNKRNLLTADPLEQRGDPDALAIRTTAETFWERRGYSWGM
ncbi:hypothetical protein RvY_18681 [Ramazzottius varieornatus]|uniref:Uncharacterized protein n=1 Tax=Ramazzottius varieornatus TaxID=947166 RepID=A0A1D1W842_RAMVA|nr:hypothetical protein RvY_18681 [Ramazzottius varieornatus]